MITDRDVQELLHYQPKYPVLSIYMNLDPTDGNADAHRLRLRSMLKEVTLSQDANAVLQFFDHQYDWSGRSVAVFSCAPDNFLKVFPLAVPVRSRLRVSDRPHLKPLADLLDSYGGYGVVLVDKQGARFFHFHLGELQEQDGVLGETVRHTKRGGGSQSPGRRGGVAGQTGYVEEVTERNMREAVESAIHFFAEKHVRRIVIGGTEDNVALFRSQLPKAWQSLVIGSFPISMLATHTEVLEHAMQIGEEAETRRETHLAKTVVTQSAKGRGGVVGLEATLNSVREGRIQTLLIRDGYRAPGNRCTSCGYISAQPIETCPFCGGKTEQIPDAVELAVRNIMQSGGEVEVLRAGQVVKGFDQIGAVLRY
jgi:peptide subunit release factor 1 (eRF1)